VQGNLRVFSSPENGGKWSFALYDLDWAFYYKGCAFYMLLNGDSNMPMLLHRVIRNPDFRDRCLRRYAELIQGPLSNEHVLEKIDEFVALLEPEAPRDRARWHKTMKDWYDHVQLLRDFIIDNDWAKLSIERFCAEAFIGPVERAEYFGY
jgi:spore coat protein CotH